MRWRTTGILGVLPALLCSAAAMAQAPSPTPALTQFIRNGWLRFQVNAGRVVMEGSRFGNSSSSSTSGAHTEKLTLRLSNGQRSVSYELSTPEEEVSFEIASADQLSIRRSGKPDSSVVPLQFTQVPGEPISLIVGRDPQQQLYRAATLWHLLITQPDECRQHLVPLLEILRPDWKLAETTAAMETKLLQAASVGRTSDRQRWAALVAQLADERFSKREAADRELRAAGRIVLSYLRGLDDNRLDAEQQYRIRRIIRSLSRQTGDDTAEGFAPQLVEDPEVWLALLSRQEEATRRLAARQLAAILEGPIRFDPAADAATRKAQIEQLRARIQGRQAQTPD